MLHFPFIPYLPHTGFPCSLEKPAEMFRIPFLDLKKSIMKYGKGTSIFMWQKCSQDKASVVCCSRNYIEFASLTCGLTKETA